MWNIILLGLVSLFTDISSEMVYPLVPLYLINSLGATPAIVGIIEGIAESLASLLKVFSGALSDKSQKRKPLAILGYIFSGFSKLLMILALSWQWVLWSRIGDRFGKGVRTAPRDALIAESANPKKMGYSFGLHRMLDTLGAVIGVMLAYFLFTNFKGDYKSVFIWALVPAILGMLMLFPVREKNDKDINFKKQPLFNWSSINPCLKKFLLVVFLFALGNSSNQFLLLRASNLGFSTQKVILLYLVFNIVYALVAFPAGAFSDRIGRRKLLVAGYIFYGFVYLGFALASEVYLWPLFGLYGVYNAATEGVEKALVAEFAPEEQKATLLGMHATLVGIGLLPASLIAGLLWKYFGASATFYFGGMMGLLAAFGLAMVLSDEKPKNRII
ncbi:MAG: MFS transporter [Eubacteriales bacterium]|jgi:MFS family permease